MVAEQARRIGARMRERRDELGLTQREIADRTGNPSATKDYTSRYERGEHLPNDLTPWAKALDTTVADLMAGPVAERKPTGGDVPDVMGALNGGGPHLARIEEKIDELLRIARQEDTEVEPGADEGLPPAKPPPLKEPEPSAPAEDEHPTEEEEQRRRAE